MKLFVVLSLFAAALAAPQGQNNEDVQVVRYETNNSGLDAYNFLYELSNGIKHQEQGQLKNQGTDDEGIAVQGEYAWTAPDGLTYIVTYTADERGFLPQIQQPPGGAVPPAVVASLLG